MVTRHTGPIWTIDFTPERLDRFTLGAAAASPGLVLGEDEHGGLLSIRMFRPHGSRVVVIADPWLTMIMGFRALALGAAISIRSPDPTRWSQLHGTQMERDAWVRPPEWPEHPRLAIVEGESELPAPDAPWTAVLLSLMALTPSNVSAAAHADAVIVRGGQLRLTGEQLARVAQALTLDHDQAGAIVHNPADVVTVAARAGARGAGELRQAHISPTVLETRLVGGPRAAYPPDGGSHGS
jgi:hypothetical protein